MLFVDLQIHSDAQYIKLIISDDLNNTKPAILKTVFG